MNCIDARVVVIDCYSVTQYSILCNHYLESRFKIFQKFNTEVTFFEIFQIFDMYMYFKTAW